MKIRLSVSDEKYDEVRNFLNDHGIETDDESEYVLSQRDKYPARVSVRDDDGTKIFVSINDIVTVESYGHSIEVHTKDKVYKTSESLSRFENILDPEKYLRVSNSVIIKTDQIEKVTPTLYMKFILVMKNSEKVDVTRNYYSKFKKFFGI